MADIDEGRDPADRPNLEGEEGGEDREAQERAEEVQSTITRGLERAWQYFQDNVEPDLKMATDYYHGREFGDEEDGRSKVVSQDVGDATRAMLPSLMRVFFGPEKAVEYRGRTPEADPMAEQATDYVNYIIQEDNPGFITFHSAFKDAFVRRLGVIKWWFDSTYRMEGAEYTGLDPEALQAFAADDTVVTVDVLRQNEDGTADVRVTRKENKGCIRIAAVPPEEFIYTPQARDLDTAPLVAHVREVPVSDLIAMGLDEELIEEAAGQTRGLNSNDLQHARQITPWVDDSLGQSDERDESQQLVLYGEVYALVDTDGDGISELRMFQVVGPKYDIANGDGLGELVDEVPFADFCPEPEPHTLVGLGNFDLLRDVQRVKSQILRGTLNSLAAAIEPKTEIVTGEVNVKDLLSPEMSGIIRVTKPGMMREVTTEFVGAQTLPVLEYYDEIKENRTGQTKAAAGLDADSLQSSTKAAVAATLSASQQRLEMIARVFAETGMKRLFRGLLRMVVSHQDQERTVLLRGKWVTVDPRRWDASMYVQVNVALGQGTPEDRLNIVAGVLAAQKELMAAGSPLVTNVELRRTLAKGVELAGWRNADFFFRPWGEQEEQQMQQMKAQQPPEPSPEMALVQVEQQKAQASAQVAQMKAQTDIQIRQQELALREREIQLQDDRERDRMAREFALKELELQMKYSSEVNKAAVDADVARDRAAQDSQVRLAQAGAEAEVALHRAHLDAEVRREAAVIQADATRQASQAKES